MDSEQSTGEYQVSSEKKIDHVLQVPKTTQLNIISHQSFLFQIIVVIFITNLLIIYTVWRLSVEVDDDDEKFKSKNVIDQICKLCLKPENLTRSVREELEILSRDCNLNLKPILITEIEKEVEELGLSEELLAQPSDSAEVEEALKLSLDGIEEDETEEDLRTTIFLFIYRLFSH